MIKFDNVDVWGFEHALRGMRNPMNSWNKSDSKYCDDFDDCSKCSLEMDTCSTYIIGGNDMNLAQKLIRGGAEHRKFLRQIFVSVDITAPIYWWKEFDTYKVGTTANSTSTMHKIHAKEFTLDDFSWEHLLDGLDAHEDGQTYGSFMPLDVLSDVIIPNLNRSREKYLETKDKKYWWQMIQLLPSSYNQTRTVTMTYENLLNMYRQRKKHKLDEWSIEFMRFIDSLQYANELIKYNGENN